MTFDIKRASTFLILFYPFSYVYTFEFSVGGASLSFIRDVFFFGILLFLFIISFFGENKNILNKKYLFIHMSIYAFYVIVIVSFILSPYRFLVFPFLLRISIILLIISFLLRLNFNINDLHYAYKLLYGSFALYVILSLLLIPLLGFSSAGGLQGIGGQHFSKFVFLLSSVFYLTVYIRYQKSKITLMFFLLSLLAMVLVLQRGAIIAFIIGLFVVLISGNKRRKLWGTVFFILLMPVVSYLIMSNDQIMSYAFFDAYGPEVIFNSLLDGKFDWSMIRSRGRFEVIELVTSNSDLLFLGNGAGYTKSLLSTYFFLGKEPHNDLIFIAYDFGVIAVILFLLFFVLVFLFVNSISLEYKIIEFFIIFCKASLSGLFFWMLVSNVLIYSTYALMVPLFFLCILFNYNKG